MSRGAGAACSTLPARRLPCGHFSSRTRGAGSCHRPPPAALPLPSSSSEFACCLCRAPGSQGNRSQGSEGGALSPLHRRGAAAVPCIKFKSPRENIVTSSRRGWWERECVCVRVCVWEYQSRQEGTLGASGPCGREAMLARIMDRGDGPRARARTPAPNHVADNGCP